MDVIKRFQQIAEQEKFKGWPMVGDWRLGLEIPHFGQLLEYDLQTPSGKEHYVSLLRYFGWCNVFGVTSEGNVVTLVQWKPGVNRATWGLPPGGIEKIDSATTKEDIISRAQEIYLRETGYGKGTWTYLKHVMIETGKYRGAVPQDHGFGAHMILATNLVKLAEAQPKQNEIMEILEVPLADFEKVLASQYFEGEVVNLCALLALRKLTK